MNSTLPFLQLEIRPTRRNEVTDLRPLVEEAVARGELPSTRRFLFVSHHTTAGFPDPRLRLRLGPDPRRLASFLEGLRDVFPPGAGYQHDRLEERRELTADQRAREPLNADAHLAFIGGGFTNTLLLHHDEEGPVWLVDFDGTWETRGGDVLHRQRRVTVIGLDEEVEEARLHVRIATPPGAGAMPLSGPGTELLEAVEAALEERDLRLGRVRLRLESSAPGTGVTVNEAEALLVERDLSDILSSPLRYAHTRGLPRVLDALRFSPERRERILGRTRTSPAPRLLRLRREVSLAVVPPIGGPEGPGRLLLGQYQSPILLQREGAAHHSHMVSATLYRFL
jgi:thiamine phosphate synthase YjbQ (UPF0047 family)